MTALEVAVATIGLIISFMVLIPMGYLLVRQLVYNWRGVTTF